jgi:hypothetical protein
MVKSMTILKLCTTQIGPEKIFAPNATRKYLYSIDATLQALPVAAARYE